MMLALLALFFFSSLGQEIRFEVVLPDHTRDIISPYRNANFSQEIRPGKEGVVVSVWSRNYLSLILNDRVYTDYAYLERIEPELAATYRKIISKSIYLKDFMKNLSMFLGASLAYTEDDLPQDAPSVLRQGRGNCIGFSNLTQVMLRCAGIPSRQAKGFLLSFNQNRAEPISHRWLEITLAGRFPFFFDPQYQSFTGRYILVNENVAFEQIERFNGLVLTLNRKIKTY